jgi:hypothetical protein
MSGGTALEFICYVGAGLGLVAYALGVLRHRQFARAFNTAGLFLTAGALILLPTALQIGAPGARVGEGWITAILLLLAMLAQGVAAVGRRRPRTGLKERASDARRQNERASDARTPTERASDRREAV